MTEFAIVVKPGMKRILAALTKCEVCRNFKLWASINDVEFNWRWNATAHEIAPEKSVQLCTWEML